MEVFYKDSSNMFKPFGIKLNFNICQILARKKQGHFLEEYAVHHLKTLTNINHSCPISVRLNIKTKPNIVINENYFSQGHLYARDFYFDELSLPPIPLQDYKITFNFTYSKPIRQLAVIMVFFEVFEDYYKNRRPKPRSKALIFN